MRERTVLMIGDDGVNTEIVRFMLSRRGHSVAVARKTDQVPLMLRRRIPNVVLLDERFREDGVISLLRSIRGRNETAATRIFLINCPTNRIENARGIDGIIEARAPLRQILAAVENGSDTRTRGTA